MKWPVVAMAVLCACDASGAGRAEVQVRDSAGIRIVENGRAQWAEGEEWRVDSVPLLDLGGDESVPAQVFNRIVAVRRLSDGRIVVGDGGSNELRWFAADGTHLFTRGRNGDGPGEFRALYRVEVSAQDSVFAFDIRHLRATVFAPEGGFVRAAPFVSTGAISPSARFEDGTWFVQASAGFGHGPGPVRWSLVLARFGVDGASFDTIAAAPEIWGESHLLQIENRVYNLAVPFGRTVLTAVSGRRVFAGNGDRFEVHVYEPGIGLAAVYRVERDEKPVSDADEARFRAQVTERVTGSLRHAFEQEYDEIESRSTMPAYSALQTDRSGHLWARAFEAFVAEPRAWTVFDPDGRLLGEVTMPAGVRVMDIDAGHVVGVWRDDLDVEHVRVYRLRR